MEGLGRQCGVVLAKETPGPRVRCDGSPSPSPRAISPCRAPEPATQRPPGSGFHLHLPGLPTS